MSPQTVVRIPSKSSPDTTHVVVIDPAHLTARCDCRGYLYRGRCSHITAALAMQAPDPATLASKAAAARQRVEVDEMAEMRAGLR